MDVAGGTRGFVHFFLFFSKVLLHQSCGLSAILQRKGHDQQAFFLIVCDSLYESVLVNSCELTLKLSAVTENGCTQQ